MPNIDYGGLSNVYTFMYWQSITDTTSDQYKLKTDTGMQFDNEGFGKIDGRYVIACTDPTDNGGMFGTVGDYVDWVLADSTTLHTVVGDTKSKSDPNWIPIGHQEGSAVSVVEFIVNRHNWGKDNPGTSSNHPEWAGQIQSWTNIGNYWNNRPTSTTGFGFYDALTANQKLYTMYLCGKWGAKLLWDYENHTDEGKVWRLGFMGWGGIAVYRFLNTMESNEYGKPLMDALTKDLQAWSVLAGNPDAAFFKSWPSNKGYFSDTLAKSWVDCVAKVEDDAIRYQEWYWCIATESHYFSDNLWAALMYLNTYMKNNSAQLSDAPELDEIKRAFYSICAIRCFLDKGFCNRIAQAWASGYDFQRLHNTACVYLDRQTQSDDTATRIKYLNDIYGLLTDWDGDTLPEKVGYLAGFGENGNGTSSGAGGSGTESPTTSWSSQVKYVDFYGTQMIIHGAGGSKLQLYKTNGNVWYPKAGSGTTSSGDSNTGDNKPYDPDTGSGDKDYTQIPVFDALKQFYLDHENAYDYAPAYDGDERNYTDPRVDGCTNCSAFITWCATQIAPDSDMARSGYYTGTMAGMGEKVASGAGGQFPYNLARPGDVLLLNHNGYNPDYDHVELFMGTTAQGNDTGSELWGAGSAPCPHRNYSAQALINNGYWTDWQVRRISWGD